MPDGFVGMVVADEQQVANPVGICLDQQQSLYIAETFRQQRGVEDNRFHMDWLHDDLAAQTVEDRKKYIIDRTDGQLEQYTSQGERIRLLTDRDGDRVMDRSVVFADGFDDILDGTGADVRVRDGDVYYACIPHLWRLRDDDGDGKSDRQVAMHGGFGVRFAFRGHDLHGLKFGPDGRLYFSIGDRGLHVTTKEGQVLHLPDQGAVLRCEPDGSHLEIYASGLRNPQDLAFDEFGNLFTCDNNSDHDDRARIVYLVPGSDSGWRMHYQYLPDRGPWLREGLCRTRHAGQAAYILPPLAYLGDGPSGLAYDPGVGLPGRLQGQFFLCDFRGTVGNSGLRTFGLEPDGASFRLAKSDQFLWRILATDVEFASDGSLYVADWISGWEGTGSGRVVRIWSPEHVVDDPPTTDPTVLRGRSRRQLAKLLTHPDQRVRQEAQFALAALGNADYLLSIAQNHSERLARIHAIWAVGQIGRRRELPPAPVLDLFDDDDPEIRAQTARIVGDMPWQDEYFQPLVAALDDESLRVQFFAALALANCSDAAAIEPLLDLLARNQNRDLFLRHACVMGLVGQGEAAELVAAISSSQPTSVRLGILLVLRRLGDRRIARCLDDDDPAIVLEAARAIHDDWLGDAVVQLAEFPLSTAESFPEEVLAPLARRVINANYRIGRAGGVLQWAQSSKVPEKVRRMAIQALQDWRDPPPLDLVLGSYRPVQQQRDTTKLEQALHKFIPDLLAQSHALEEPLVRLASKYHIATVSETLRRFALDTSAAVTTRVAALDALSSMQVDGTAELLQSAAGDRSYQVRVAALGHLVALQPDDADVVRMLSEAMDRGQWQEQQLVVPLIADCEADTADHLLRKWFKKLERGDCPPQLELELREAAATLQPEAPQALALHETSDGVGQPADYRPCLYGGDARHGERLFRQRTDLSCARCHVVGREGDAAGPNLSSIGRDKSREYLLEAILFPNKSIALGFESTVILTDAGRFVSGIVKQEDDQQVELQAADGRMVTVRKAEIDDRNPGISAMPTDLHQRLSLRDVRDLVAFLAQQQGYRDGEGSGE